MIEAKIEAPVKLYTVHMAKRPFGKRILLLPGIALSETISAFFFGWAVSPAHSLSIGGQGYRKKAVRPYEITGNSGLEPEICTGLS